MNNLEFYDKLLKQPDGTIDIRGKVLVNSNNNKWHTCKKRADYISHLCEMGGPLDPNKSGFGGRNYYESAFKRSTEVVGVREAIEYDRVCSNCLRLMEEEYDLERMIIAVPSDPEPDATKGLVERFVRKL